MPSLLVRPYVRAATRPLAALLLLLPILLVVACGALASPSYPDPIAGTWTAAATISCPDPPQTRSGVIRLVLTNSARLTEFETQPVKGTWQHTSCAGGLGAEIAIEGSSYKGLLTFSVITPPAPGAAAFFFLATNCTSSSITAQVALGLIDPTGREFVSQSNFETVFTRQP